MTAATFVLLQVLRGMQGLSQAISNLPQAMSRLWDLIMEALFIL
jgi:hypothetical protein